jgi:hypothetical protein
MEKLQEMERDFEQEGLTFEVRGLDALQPLADNAHAARKRGLATMRRLTVIADSTIEEWLESNFVRLGATGFTSIPCSGSGRSYLESGASDSQEKVRIEVVLTYATCEEIWSFLRQKVLPEHQVTACVETVDVVRRNHFDVAVSGIHQESTQH